VVPQPLSELPANEAEAQQLGEIGNPNLIAAQFDLAAARAGVDIAESALYPRLSVRGELTYTDDPTATLDWRRDALIGAHHLDLNTGKDIVNFAFADHYLTYSAGENADTESEDFHAKMADDSDFQICDYSYQIQLIDGAIHLSNPLFENQKSEKCPAPEWKVGKYDFDFMTGKYALAE
jgi:hypothetical protein